MSNFAVLADTSNNDKLVEVYTHDIFYYADDYIQTELDGTKDKDILKSEFKNIIYHISDNIPIPDRNNIELLDSLFNIYLRLCSKCNVVPTLEAFSWLCNIDNGTFSDWKTGQYRKVTPQYSQTVKRWFNICKGMLSYDLTQRGGGDINKIFIAKAVYGMAETAPVQVQERTPALSLNNEQLAARLGGRIEEIADTTNDDS